MNLKSVFCCVTFMTFLCIGYVSQQTAIVKLSYELRIRENRFNEIIDHNRVLVYNNSSLKAPRYLAGKLEQNSRQLCLPDMDSVAKVKLVRRLDVQPVKSSFNRLKQNLLDVFIPKAQAALDKDK